ncbi:flagellar basal body-associated FliL family protein [Caulobacter sp. 17J80-11]|uniref:flagellar basal body-associated FliL family protein n=1 Tax=Caulobacter sp. 17J80-11 TaxID=2763502 RepID=UPI001653D6ED|nr:flagellar basal body-associated FliL family protein [Caulobacter sp. 17J80-11]MBC6981129.1 flagellar basal body-associated FliL family protein [Caulobacter sp. 17J80-11]
MFSFLKKKAAKDAAPAEGEAPESAGGDGEGGEGSKKKPPLKVLIMAGVAAVLVLGGGGAGVFMLMKPKAAKTDAVAEAGHEKPEKKKKKKEGGHGGGKGEKTLGEVREGPDGVTFYTLPDLVVNMQSLDGRPSFLKLKLTFELSDESVTERLEADAPRLQDALQSFLRELRPEDLSGSQGSYQLRMEILRRVNLIVAPEKVDAVLIEEMLIQ